MCRTLTFFLVLVCLIDAQPTLCKDHAQCSVGYYCEVITNSCRKCLRCEDLKRETPSILTTCISSVIECGPCFKGLVVDHTRDINAECVPPPKSEKNEVSSLPAYFWPVFIVSLILFVAFIGVVVFLLRNVDILKMVARTSVAQSEPMATSAPPRYEDACYTAVRTESPPPPPPPLPTAPPHPHPHPHYSTVNRAFDDESSLIQKKNAGGVTEARREAAARQEARVYNPPAYVRVPPAPPSPEPESNELFTVHDEETTESPWTPIVVENGDEEANATGDTASGSTLSSQVAAARDVTLVEPPPTKVLCVRQDSGNKVVRGAEGPSRAAPSPPSAPSGPAPPSLVVNNYNIDLYTSLHIDNTK